MPQPINKKTMEDELASHDGFGDLPREGQGGMEEIPVIPDDASGAVSQFSLMSEKRDVPQPNFSFDEFDNFGIQDQDFHGEKSETGLLSDSSSTGEDHKKSGHGSRNGIKKISLILSVVLILVISIVFSAIHWLGGKSADGRKTILRRSIEMQYHQEQRDFLVVIDAQSKKDIVSVGIEFNFLALNAYENFKKQNAIFNDTVYSFLTSQQPKEISLEYWREMVEKKLLACLTATIPQSGLARIRVTRLDRL